MSADKPSSWGRDSLSEYLQVAEENTIASFANLQPEYRRLAELDAIFVQAISNLNNSPDYHLGSFLVRAHACFRLGCRAVLSGQIAEAYMALRGVLEYALYALHIHADSSRFEIWIKRGDGEAERKTCRKAFKFAPILEEAKTKLPAKIYSVVDTLYERSIDSGAHPNALGSLVNLDIEETADSKKITIIYLHNEPNWIEGMMKETSRYGCTALHVFLEVFRTRFELLGIPARLTAIGQGI